MECPANDRFIRTHCLKPSFLDSELNTLTCCVCTISTDTTVEFNNIDALISCFHKSVTFNSDSGGPAQTSIHAQPPQARLHHIPRPQSRLMCMSTITDEMDDYIKMNPVGHSATLPLAARNQVPDFSQVAGEGRLCASYLETQGLEVRETY